MRERGIPNTELAKRLGVSETVVRRMLNPKHDTKPDKIQAALVTLGKRIVVTFEDAARQTGDPSGSGSTSLPPEHLSMFSIPLLPHT